MLILALIVLSTGEDCERYICRTSQQSFADRQCILWDGAQSTYWLRPCTDINYPYCPPVSNGASASSICTAEPAVEKPKKYPGEKCESDSDCNYAFGCSNGFCDGINFRQNCTETRECNPGLYCHYTCTEQIPIGGAGCTSDEECINNAACDYSYEELGFGLCLSAFSVAGGQKIKSCSGGRSRLCQSGRCTTFNGKAVCIGLLETQSALPADCTSNDDCSSVPDPVTGITLESQCLCGYNAKGFSICQLNPGDLPYKNYLDALARWYNSTEINYCNSERRDNFECIQDFWSRDKYLELSYLYQSAEYYTWLQYNDDCVKAIYELDYYVLQEEYENSKKHGDFAYIMVASLFFALFA